MTSDPASQGDRPLSRSAKAWLIVNASATILLCYLFSTVTLVLLLLMLGVEAILLVAGARFGLAFVMADLMKRHVPLLGMFVRSFWLTGGAEYRIVLQPTSAPRLFTLLDQLAARFAISVPHEVAIEMNCGAWVRLQGYRRGAGRTTLGLGYDLLAGLTESEVEAVLAHEMAHAKLVSRGLKSWLNKGVSRSAELTRQLSERLEEFRAAKRSSALTATLLRVSDLLTRTAARLVAAYSRQDEFEADRGAAELCGSAPLRSSLQRLEAMHEKLARMPWSERVAQLELEGSFSVWLMEELKAPVAAAAGPAAVHVRDPYSTHPTLHDRIAALPADDARPRSGAPGIALLAEPDRVARDLMHEIQRVLAEQEQKDTKSLGRWAKKTQRTSNIRWQQLPGILIVIVGIFVSLMTLATETWIGHLVAVAIIALGVFAWRLGRYRDRRALPVPRFAQIKQAWSAERPADLGAQEKAIEEELRARLASIPKSRPKLAALLDAADAALANCDYLRAHVAARLALEINNKSVEAALALAVASGALGDGQQVGQMLHFIVQRTAMGTQSTRWGAAWALVLLGDWNAAEALLWQVHEKQPDEPTFLLLLASTQAERGKLQSAIENARRALALTQQDAETVKLLARVLLEAGRLQEAGAQLATLRTVARNDPETAMLHVRWHLARREAAPATEWGETFCTLDASPAARLQLAEALEVARRDDTAAELFGRVLAAEFHPQAHLGLARLAARRHDKETARTHLRDALNFEKTVGARGVGPGPLFHAILGQLMSLDDPHEHCQAWIVTPPDSYPVQAIRGRALLVYASDQRDAEARFQALVAAMQPSAPPPPLRSLHWELAAKDRQPERPVHPGVQGVL